MRLLSAGCRGTRLIAPSPKLGIATRFRMPSQRLRLRPPRSAGIHRLRAGDQERLRLRFEAGGVQQRGAGARWRMVRPLSLLGGGDGQPSGAVRRAANGTDQSPMAVVGTGSTPWPSIYADLIGRCLLQASPPADVVGGLFDFENRKIFFRDVRTHSFKSAHRDLRAPLESWLMPDETSMRLLPAWTQRPSATRSVAFTWRGGLVARVQLPTRRHRWPCSRSMASYAGSSPA